jgi:hypothetical protein
LKTCHRVAAGAETIEQAEKEVYICVNQGIATIEAMAFPTLFPHGNGTFGQQRIVDMRFEVYVRHLLRLRQNPTFLKHDRWIVFVTNRAAVLRAVTKSPPMWQDTPQHLGLEETRALKLLTEFNEQQAFCFRYLLGDKEAAGLAQLVLHDDIKSKRK